MTPQRIKALRSSLALTQSAFGRDIGVTSTTISLWETGRTSPSPYYRQRLSTLEGGCEDRTSPPVFRPIQYLGSKLKIAPRIRDLMDSVSDPEDTVGDLFSGSSAVSGVLCGQRRTLAVDVQAYAATLADAMLNATSKAADVLRTPAFFRAIEEVEHRRLDHYREMVVLDDRARAAAVDGDGRPLDQLISFGSIAAYRQTPTNDGPAPVVRALTAVAGRLNELGPHYSKGLAAYYGGAYFSMRQAVALDAFNEVLDGLDAEARKLGRAVLLSVASELVNTVGKQFAQPMRIVKSDGAAQPVLLARAIRDRGLDVSKTWEAWLGRWEKAISEPRIGGHAVQADVLDFVDKDTECSAFYADPPYTIDHYSRFYHVLETLVLRDQPLLDTHRKAGADRIMRGLYRAGRYQSPFSVPRMVAPAFERLFKGVARGGRSLVLSYSPFDPGQGHRPRLLNLEEIVGLARAEFRRVEIVDIANHSHRKLNMRHVNVEAPIAGEVLIVCEP